MSTIEFTFGSDTNRQLFIEWLVNLGKRFEIEGLVVAVGTQYVDDAVWQEMRDLGGSFKSTGR